jgi:anti-sigma regulatory factor (Ser/Thr protein kinase)
MAARWPLQDSLEFVPLTGAVPCARLHARQILWGWGLTRLEESAELIVTELINNAITASRSLPRVSPVRLWLLSDRIRVLVLVWDACPKPPQPTGIDLYAESGRGLLLVETFSDQWDWYVTNDTGGKVVWALIASAMTDKDSTNGGRGPRGDTGREITKPSVGNGALAHGRFKIMM